MKAFLIVLFCSVYTAQAWLLTYKNLKLDPFTGEVPQKKPPTPEDQQATRKAKTFINFLRFVPQLNPLQVPSLGPYEIELPELNFRGTLLLDNVVVSELRKINMAELSVFLNPNVIDFKALLPVVHAAANFKVTGNLGNEAINTEGKFNASLFNLEVSGSVGPKITTIDANTGRRVFVVNDATISIFLENAQLNMEMNNFGDEFKSILKDFLDNADKHTNTLNDILRVILKGVNKELTRVTSAEILNYLLGNGAPSLNLSG